MCSAHGVCDLAFQPGEAAWIIITMAFHSLVPLAVILGLTVWSFSLFYLALTKHHGATGTGEAAEPLNCRPFQEMLTVSVADYTASLVSWITVVPIERVDDFILSFFFSCRGPLVFLLVWLAPCLCCFHSEVCQRDPWLQQSQQSMSFVQCRILWVTSHIN